MQTYGWLIALVGGLGVFVAYGALALWPRKAQLVRPQAQDQFSSAGPGAGLAYGAARSLLFPPPRWLGLEGIEQQLKAANWYWGPGEAHAPLADAPFHSVAGYLAACVYQAVVYGALALLVGLVLVSVAEIPLVIGLLLAVAGAGMGWTTPGIQLQEAVSRRRYRLTAEMAFRLPELAATVATGKSIIAAMRALTSRPGGPFITELNRALRTYDLTQSFRTAVNVVVAHNQHPPLTEFFRQLLLVEQRGGSIAPALNVLAVEAQETLRLQLVEQGQANKRDMGLPVVAGSMLVMLALIAGPILWIITSVL